MGLRETRTAHCSFDADTETLTIRIRPRRPGARLAWWLMLPVGAGLLLWEGMVAGFFEGPQVENPIYLVLVGLFLLFLLVAVALLIRGLVRSIFATQIIEVSPDAVRWEVSSPLGPGSRGEYPTAEIRRLRIWPEPIRVAEASLSLMAWTPRPTHFIVFDLGEETVTLTLPLSAETAVRVLAETQKHMIH